MISKKLIVAVMVMAFALTACSSDNGKKANVPPKKSNTVASAIKDDEKNKSENQSDISDDSKDSSHIKTDTDNQKNNSTANKPTSKPSKKPSESSSKPTNGSASKPNKPTDNNSGSANKPNEENNGGVVNKPTPHVHKWEKQPIGSVFDWTNSSGPDENGYTSNKDIAQNRNGKKMGIYACVKCYKYLGHHENDIWEVRYWEHIDQPGPCLGVGYTGCHVLAIYEAFYCPECEAWKRGDKAVSYGYYDYSNGVKWIPLVQWQIEELNLAF